MEQVLAFFVLAVADDEKNQSRIDKKGNGSGDDYKSAKKREGKIKES